MGKRNPLITGTLILTATGLTTRMIGFFYRIYLSRLFGEEGMGVYQLISPVLALAFSITAAGLQTAISKYVAASAASGEERNSFRYLLSGLGVSLSLSFLCTGFVLTFSEEIASGFLLEPRTASMLRIISLSFPLSAVHSCINGYFYGIKKAGLPAATQLIEQFCRVGCVFLASSIALNQNTSPTINVAVIGLVAGEFCAMIVSVSAAYLRFCRVNMPASLSCFYAIKKVCALAAPLSLTRIVINLLQSVEAVYIPTQLQLYGYDTATALSVYGVLTGMALPFIFFPNALTSSLSLMLLPIVSEADATGNLDAVKRAVRKTVQSCLGLGCICTLGFLLLGKWAGVFLFDSALAGHFIASMSFLCPFLYLSNTLSSILHGLGKAAGVFFVHVSSLLIRLAFVFYLIPKWGIDCYILGMLLSQIYDAACFLLLLRRTVFRRLS